MTTSVSIARSIPLSRDALLPLVRAQIAALEEASEHGTVMLSTGIPGSGRVAVAVRVRVSYPPPRTPRFGVTIVARQRQSTYPAFRGELTLASAGSAATVITLAGEYDVPLGILGRAFDRTAGRGIAQQGLSDVLDRLVVEVTAEADRSADAAYRAGRSETR